MIEEKYKSVSVVIATRDRGGQIRETIKSILENDYKKFDIIIVDQSSSNSTEAAIPDYMDNSQITYIRDFSQGLACARNKGITEAKGEIIAITDDDCMVPVNWIASIVEAFGTDPRIGIVFGNVNANHHDSSMGFIPAYSRSSARLISKLADKHEADGIGACMGLQKEAWKVLQGFDECFGAGGLLKSNSEGDLVIRALGQGFCIYETPICQVIHNGFRNWEEAKSLINRYWYGTGAMYAKHLKLKPFLFSYLLIKLAMRWAFSRSIVASSIGEKSHRFRRLFAFGDGFIAGISMRVDKRIEKYVIN